MKYKIGDKVKVREDLQDGEMYGTESVASNMINFKGKEVTIIGFDDDEYIIEGNNYNWTDEMFENNISSKKKKLTPTKKTIEHIISGNKTIVIIHNKDGSYKKGIALCSPEDKFDENVGFKLAYDRAMGIKENKDDINLQKIDSELIILQRMCLDCCYSSTIFDNLNTLKTISDLGKRISKLRYEIKKYI